MLKRMRWRFIMAAMAAFLAVMTLIVSVLNIGYYQITVSRLDSSIAMLKTVESAPTPDGPPEKAGGFFENKSPEARYMLRFFAVQRDADGVITDIRRDFVTSIDTDQARSYADLAYKSGKSTGFVHEYRYASFETDGTITTIFLNASNEQQFMKNLLLLSLGVASFSLLMVFSLVVLFSGHAIAPFVKNMALQKQFITDAGHELKTPLTSISASADILALENENNEWVTNIKRQTHRLSKLVSGLVTLSRLDEASPFPEREPFSLSDLLWEITEPFMTTAKAKSKRCDLTIDDNLTLNGDRDAIGRMLSVLLDNAVRYSDEGGVIRLTAGRKGRQTIIEIYNTCTLSERIELDRLFDRFYRPDKSRSSATGGTGIGLSIAKATAEAHGGKITVDRPDDHGIRFRIVF